MLDQLFGLLLLGLGLAHPVSYPAVKGDQTQSAESSNSGSAGTTRESSSAAAERTYKELRESNIAKSTRAAQLRRMDTTARPTGFGKKPYDTAKVRQEEATLSALFAARQEKLKTELAHTVQTAQTQHAKERTTFERHLQTVTDPQKKVTALRIDAKIPELNTRLTGNMTDQLINMQKVLETASLRLGELKNSNTAIDTSATASRIATAQAQITTALSAVSAQSQKTYTAAGDVSTPESLKTAMTALLATFESDIQSTRGTVIAAKASVKAALEEVGTLL